MKAQQTETHMALEHCWDSECDARYAFQRNPFTDLRMILFTTSAAAPSGSRVPALSPSGGCSVAPPDQRLRRPRPPGARPSSLLLPTGFLRCSEDLQATHRVT